MYDVRQFRPALYMLLILGFSGFALAAQSPGLWAFSITAVIFNIWIIHRGWFSPLPRMMANLVTLGALLYIVLEVRLSTLAPIMVIGQFLVLLQLVKLYEQRANRDYAQLLVLSLLLVVAASINTASLLFGLMLIAYLFLSLYCCLLFHLKVESDHAKAAIAISEAKLNPASLRHDQRYLASSMRKLAFFVALVAVTTAVLVFLFFPRGAGANLLAPLQQRAADTLTGFSDNVNFQNIAKISQNNEVVARVNIWHRYMEGGKEVEKPVEGTQTILLRGGTLNVYHGGAGLAGATWQWERSVEEQAIDAGRAEMDWFGDVDPNTFKESWRQQVWLNPTGTNVMFALAGPVALRIERDAPRDHRFVTDETLQFPDAPQQQTFYEVISRGSLDFQNLPGTRETLGNPRGWFSRTRESVGETMGLTQPDLGPIENMKHTDAELLKEFLPIAQRPEVSGSDARGPLAPRRAAAHGALDAEIARNIERYLRDNFSYTLDLTDVRTLGDGRDPLLSFLTDFKKGHCEYFAGAMTVLCQSLGMDARMVVGFKCDEYNSTPGAGYYIVRQSHAHAWVEVCTPQGWLTYDPTSSHEAETVQQAGMWEKLKHLMDYMEYTWANSVVAYDRDNQDNVIKNTEARLTNMGIRSTAAAGQGKGWLTESIRKWFSEKNFFLVSSGLLSILIYLAFIAIFLALFGYFWEKWKLRRRARRIGLENLPASAQMRLARQLGFYDDLMQLLERYNVVRPRHLTPMEFSDSITFLPNQAYHSIQRLTQIFYRIRYGGHHISYNQRQRLNRVINLIGQTLEKSGMRG